MIKRLMYTINDYARYTPHYLIDTANSTDFYLHCISGGTLFGLPPLFDPNKTRYLKMKTASKKLNYLSLDVLLRFYIMLLR
jgi:hypothetical protein